MDSRTRSGRKIEPAHYETTRIAVIKGPDTGLVLEAAGRSLRVGTAHDNDLVLTDDTISRRHCEIELTHLGFRVRDAGSTNGIVVAQVRIYDAAYSTPLELVLGETTIAITPLAKMVDREQVADAHFGDLRGASPRMRQLFAELERFTPTDISVLIEGETGTGKDLVAESFHSASPRAEGPYVVFDCSAVAPSLVESELFGHERGAFTGAVGARPGVFEQADRGTLFLDEIGELPKDLQPKLLRALEKREVKRLGGQKAVPVNVRVVAATNRNLIAEVQRGNFRQDLYYRIAAAHVVVPPLRERLEDIPMLVEHFLKLDKGSFSVDSIPAQVWSMFAAHRWPGNVRELRNAVQRLIIAPEFSVRLGQPIEAEPTAASAASLPAEPAEPLRIARRTAADAFERDYVVQLLARTGGNVTRAAAIAEVSRQMIQKLMRKHGIS